MIPRSVGKIEANEKTLLFVVGLTRSGTSLLYALLNQHPQIALMYEANAFYPGLRSFTPHNLERLEIWNQVISRHGLKAIDLERVHDARSLYLAYAREKKDCKIYGEKSPVYPAYLRAIRRKTPDAHFLFLHRDFSEVYRSVLSAGLSNPWFTKRGAFHRLLREQEKMLQDLQWLEQKGAKIHQISYRALVGNTEQSMREICAFLQIDFSSHMGSLNGADLSAIEENPEHLHLRRRDIGVRKDDPIILPNARLQAISRFQLRWNRLLDRDGSRRTPATAEVKWPERLSNQTLGAACIFYYLLVRWIYEAVPVRWIRNYRALKYYLKSADEADLLSRPMRRKTLLLALGVLGLISAADWITGPVITFGPLYLIPLAVVTYRVGPRAGILLGFLASALWTSMQIINSSVPNIGLVFFWNLALRSAQFVIFTMLIAVCSQLLTSLQDKTKPSAA